MELILIDILIDSLIGLDHKRDQMLTKPQFNMTLMKDLPTNDDASKPDGANIHEAQGGQSEPTSVLRNKVLTQLAKIMTDSHSEANEGDIGKSQQCLDILKQIQELMQTAPKDQKVTSNVDGELKDLTLTVDGELIQILVNLGHVNYAFRCKCNHGTYVLFETTKNEALTILSDLATFLDVEDASQDDSLLMHKLQRTHDRFVAKLVSRSGVRPSFQRVNELLVRFSCLFDLEIPRVSCDLSDNKPITQVHAAEPFPFNANANHRVCLTKLMCLRDALKCRQGTLSHEMCREADGQLNILYAHLHIEPVCVETRTIVAVENKLVRLIQEFTRFLCSEKKFPPGFFLFNTIKNTINDLCVLLWTPENPEAHLESTQEQTKSEERSTKTTPVETDTKVKPKKVPAVITDDNKSQDIAAFFAECQCGKGAQFWHNKLDDAVKKHGTHIVDAIFARAPSNDLHMSMTQKMNILKTSLKAKKADMARTLIRVFDLDAHTMQASCDETKWGELANFDSVLCRELIEQFDLPKSCFKDENALLRIEDLPTLKWVVDRFGFNKRELSGQGIYGTVCKALQSKSLEEFCLFIKIVHDMVDDNFRELFTKKNDANILLDCIKLGKLAHFNYLRQKFKLNPTVLQRAFKTLVEQTPAHDLDTDTLKTFLDQM